MKIHGIVVGGHCVWNVSEQVLVPLLVFALSMLCTPRMIGPLT